jgi:hypothetical protein
MKEDRNPQLLVCFTDSVSMQASFEDERFISINSTQSFYLYWTGVFFNYTLFLWISFYPLCSSGGEMLAGT